MAFHLTPLFHFFLACRCPPVEDDPLPLMSFSWSQYVAEGSSSVIRAGVRVGGFFPP